MTPAHFTSQEKHSGFAVAVLILLTVQKAGATILTTYTQRQSSSSSAGARGELGVAADHAGTSYETAAPLRRYDPAHVLAMAEVIKLVGCLVWCGVHAYFRVVERRVHPRACLEGSERDDDSTAEAEVEDENAIAVEVHEIADGGGGRAVGDEAALLDQLSTDNTSANRSAHMNSRTSSTRSAEAWRKAASSKSVGLLTSEALIEVPACRVDGWAVFREVTRQRAFWCEFLQDMRMACGLHPAKLAEVFLMAVPAVLYALQNYLVFTALSLLDPATFQLVYQIRILILAVLMRFTLDFKLSRRQCVALVLLAIGIAMAQLGSSQSGGGDTDVVTGELNADQYRADLIKGLQALLGAALISSGSGVFMEAVLKKRANHFHISACNIHLAFSLVFFVIKFMMTDWGTTVQVAGQNAYKEDFFYGFTGLVWLLVVTQAIGSILIALVMRYADNIVKSFSTSLAIVISTLASVQLFGLELSLTMTCGAGLVMLAVCLYNIK